MANITNPKLIYAKGFLLLLGGLLASLLLVVEHPTVKTALLLVTAVWCLARFYYFTFYVIEHYVDPNYRFSGLWSFVRYLLARRNHRREDERTRRRHWAKDEGPTRPA